MYRGLDRVFTVAPFVDNEVGVALEPSPPMPIPTGHSKFLGCFDIPMSDI